MADPKQAKTKKNFSGKSETEWAADPYSIGTVVFSTYDGRLREAGVIVEALITEAGDIRRVLWPDGAITSEYAERLIRAEDAVQDV